MATKKSYSKGGSTGFKAGRPSGYANGGKVEGVSQHKSIAMGGSHDVQSGGKGVAQNTTGKFQRRK